MPAIDIDSISSDRILFRLQTMSQPVSATIMTRPGAEGARPAPPSRSSLDFVITARHLQPGSPAAQPQVYTISLCCETSL